MKKPASGSTIKEAAQAALKWLSGCAAFEAVKRALKAPPEPGPGQALLLELEDGEVTVTDMRPALPEEDFNGEVGSEVDASGFALEVTADHRWCKVVRSYWDSVVVEIAPAVWARVPREMIWEER